MLSRGLVGLFFLVFFWFLVLFGFVWGFLCWDFVFFGGASL